MAIEPRADLFALALSCGLPDKFVTFVTLLILEKFPIVVEMEGVCVIEEGEGEDEQDFLWVLLRIRFAFAAAT